MRRLLRDVIEGRDLGDVSTLGDPSVLAALQKSVARDATEKPAE
jgi:acetyl-CoA synthetase